MLKNTRGRSVLDKISPNRNKEQTSIVSTIAPRLVLTIPYFYVAVCIKKIFFYFHILYYGASLNCLEIPKLYCRTIFLQKLSDYSETSILIHSILSGMCAHPVSYAGFFFTTGLAQFPYFIQRIEMSPPATLLNAMANQIPKAPIPKVNAKK